MGEPNYFRYGEKEIAYLKSKDKKLAAVIDAVGPIRRETDRDLFRYENELRKKIDDYK